MSTEEKRESIRTGGNAIYKANMREEPTFGQEAYNCPHCNAYAQHKWSIIETKANQLFTGAIEDLRVSSCSYCGKYSLWKNTLLIYPAKKFGVEPNQDLNDDIKNDFNEARTIINQSPRGAAALLRLAIQKLCVQLGESGKNINDDIASMVKKGLPPMVQQSLDYVRIIGNNAVHPGHIDLQDTPEIAEHLFNLINIIAEVMISQPKHVQSLYNSLPSNLTKAIENRDKP